MNKKWIAGIMIVLAILLAVYSYIALPDLVTVQIDFSGNPSRQEPKLLALLFPLVLTMGGSIAYIVSEVKEKQYLLLAIVGILVAIITIIANL